MNKTNCIFLILIFTCNTYGSHVQDLYDQARYALEQQDKDQAIAYLLKAHTIDPTYDEITIHLASIHFFSREYEKAIPYFEHYLVKKPYDTDMLFYLGSAHNRLGQFDQANHYLKKSYEYSHDTLAKIELLKNYLRSAQWQNAQQYLTPKLWWYDYNIYTKRVMLDLNKSGNGIGDIIFFLRYAKILKQAGAHVSINIPKLLSPLCKCCPYIDTIITNQDNVTNPYDHEFPICIASLMLCAKDRIYLSSPEVPYLIAPKELSIEWKEKLAHDTNLKIGLYWEGTIHKAQFLGKQLANPRSVPFDCLRTLQSLKGISWYCLQKSITNWPSEFPIKSLGAGFDETNGSFMDSAAIMPQLDLIISIDGSIAHLAGALGVPVWVMLPLENDYRWFSARSDSPWYPTMRLFRQKEFGNWEPVIAEIKNELTHLLLLES